MKAHKTTHVYEKLQQLRSLACLVYDRAVVGNATPGEIMSVVGPVQTEYDLVESTAIKNDLDGVAAAIELFDHQAETRVKYAEEIMQKAKDLREAADRLRIALATDMDEKGEVQRSGELYNVSLIEGIGHGGARKHQLVIR